MLNIVAKNPVIIYIRWQIYAKLKRKKWPIILKNKIPNFFPPMRHT